MDWVIPLITACAGIGGAAVAGHFSMKSQGAVQRNENIRHAHKIAYESAVKEWEMARHYFMRQYEVGYSGPKVHDLPPLDDFIIHHLSLAAALGSLDVGRASAADFEARIGNLWARQKGIRAARVAQQGTQDMPNK